MFFGKKNDNKTNIKNTAKVWAEMVTEYHRAINEGRFEDGMKKAIEIRTAADVLILSANTVMKLRSLFISALMDEKLRGKVKGAEFSADVEFIKGGEDEEEEVVDERVEDRGTDDIGKP
jgi:hypothetical protein